MIAKSPQSRLWPAGGRVGRPSGEALGAENRHLCTTATEPTARPATNITEEHPNAFEALTSVHYDNFALFSCLLNGQRAAAIVAVTAHQADDKDGETEFHIKPLFVSIVDGLVLTDHGGRQT